jgi:precorrin-6B methylase 2
MFKAARSLARRLFRSKSGAALRDLRAGYLSQVGWDRSVTEHAAVDAAGLPIPWLTYSAIAFLGDRVGRHLDVFEFGSGNSTLWWSRAARTVTAIEHDPEWAERVSRRLPANATVTHVPLTVDGDYARFLQGVRDSYDIVVIDGRDRVNCAHRSLDALRNGGVIIWDNAERAEYQDGYALLAQRGFSRIDFAGLGPINCYASTTAIFYRADNVLGI